MEKFLIFRSNQFDRIYDRKRSMKRTHQLVYRRDRRDAKRQLNMFKNHQYEDGCGFDDYSVKTNKQNYTGYGWVII